jgi:hypothetical protein
MPLLDLTDEMIGPERTELTLDYIRSVMVWPNDEERRRLAEEAFNARSARVLLSEVAKQDPAAMMSFSDLEKVVDILHNSS